MNEELLTVSEAIIVEGKYDKIRLASVFNAVIIVTNGFGIYKDAEKMALLRHYSHTTGVIILTDSDSAGFRIRGYLKGALGGNVRNVYIPDVFGKERRKTSPSAEGKIGVEGIERKILVEAFEKSGITFEKRAVINPITKYELVELGLSGGKNSAARRCGLLKKLGLPCLLTANAMLEVLNTITDYDGLCDLLDGLDAENE